MLSLLCFCQLTHVQVCRRCVCACVCVYMFVFVSVFWLHRNAGLNAWICLCLCAQCVHNVSVSVCAHGRHGARSATSEAAAFLLSPNQSEEGSVTMSPAVWADGLFKSTTDNSGSATTLPHALIASNEVMKEAQHSQPELSCSARCSSTCLCRMSGN